MFGIKKLKNEVLDLQNKLIDLEGRLTEQTHIYAKRIEYNYLEVSNAVPISVALEKLLKELGYNVSYNYEPEKTSYVMKKIKPTKRRKP